MNICSWCLVNLGNIQNKQISLELLPVFTTNTTPFTPMYWVVAQITHRHLKHWTNKPKLPVIFLIIKESTNKGQMALNKHRNLQFVVTVLRWFEPVSRQQQLQQFMVVNSRVGSPSPGHNLPHGHPEWPLTRQGRTGLACDCLNRGLKPLHDKMMLHRRLNSPRHFWWCRQTQTDSPWPSTWSAHG